MDNTEMENTIGVLPLSLTSLSKLSRPPVPVEQSMICDGSLHLVNRGNLTFVGNTIILFNKVILIMF